MITTVEYDEPFDDGSVIKQKITFDNRYNCPVDVLRKWAQQWANLNDRQIEYTLAAYNRGLARQRRVLQALLKDGSHPEFLVFYAERKIAEMEEGKSKVKLIDAVAELKRIETSKELGEAIRDQLLRSEF